MREKMVSAGTLASRVAVLPLTEDRRDLVRDRFRRLQGGS
jgi:hypothetical protein